MREQMYSWLNGPGAVFREPLPGSTNYLSAYDEEGQLLRVKGRRASKDDEGDRYEVSEQSEFWKKVSSHGSSPSIPPEKPDDLAPFPRNRQFKSQPVLSEEMKDEIWHRVVDLKNTVRTVSMDLNVEMSRVGAVVRLKAVEKQWVEQVRRVLLSFTVRLMVFCVMRNTSIGLKDQTTGYQIYYNSLNTPIPSLSSVKLPLPCLITDACHVFKLGETLSNSLRKRHP